MLEYRVALYHHGIIPIRTIDWSTIVDIQHGCKRSHSYYEWWQASHI
jgi:hypothetical protein